jgi:TolA-binding protein
VLTALGGVILLAALMPVGWRGRLTKRVVEGASAWGPVAAAIARVRRAAEWPDARRRRLLASGLAVVVAVLGTVAVVNSGSDADSLYRKGQKLYAADRLEESLPYFREAHRLAPLSATAVHARYFEALVYLRGERWQEAGQRFQSLVETFPEAVNAPEALYHVGLCRDRVGDGDGALAAWRETLRRFPDSNWAGFARQRLVERGQDPEAAAGGAPRPAPG